MKKVLFVATVVKTHIEVFHLPYLKWFQDNGYETHVCARNDYENKEDCNISFCNRFFDLPFERSPFGTGNIKVYKQLMKIINSNQYDVIHCHTPMGGVLARLAARGARKKGTKVIYTAHGFHFFKGAPLKNWLIYYPIERYLARYTDELITINNEDYGNAKKFPVKKVTYVPGVGVETKKYNVENFNKLSKRAELGIDKDDIVLLSVGEMIKRKNHETVIRTVARLKNKNIIYLVCGRGQLEDYLRKLSISLGVENKVKFLGFRRDISEICLTSDIFIFPSYQEGLPVALMEAMSAELPIVCSKIRGNTDLIDEGRGGYLVKPNDIDGHVESIKKLINDTELRKKMGEHNKDKIIKFDINTVRKKMEQIYKQL